MYIFHVPSDATLILFIVNKSCFVLIMPNQYAFAYIDSNRISANQRIGVLCIFGVPIKLLIEIQLARTHRQRLLFN